MTLPEKGTFKIQTIGPMKSGTSKKGNPWRTFDLQFEGDPQWYGTFWTPKEEPETGKELSGTKSFDSEYNSYKFEIDRAGGKMNWNPAAAQATVMSASVQLVAGFLAIPGHYEKWLKDDPELKKLFSKYIETVNVISKRVKEMVIGMGSINAESKTVEKKPVNQGDPGPTPPPVTDDWPPDEEPVDI